MGYEPFLFPFFPVLLCTSIIRFLIRLVGKKKVMKGAWRMPWLTEAMKDVISCDKLRVGANNL